MHTRGIEPPRTLHPQRPQRCAATVTPRVHVYLVEGFEPSCGATHTCSLPFIGVSFTGLEPVTPRLDTARREEDSNPSRFLDRSAFKAVPITIRDHSPVPLSAIFGQTVPSRYRVARHGCLWRRAAESNRNVLPSTRFPSEAHHHQGLQSKVERIQAVWSQATGCFMRSHQDTCLPETTRLHYS